MSGLVGRGVSRTAGIVAQTLGAQKLVFMARPLTTLTRNGFQYDEKGLSPEQRDLLKNPEFEELLYETNAKFRPQYEACMVERERQKYLIKSGEIEFNTEAPWVATTDWRCAQLPADLGLDARPVEITGPADQANMVANAFKTGELAQKVAPELAHLHPVKYMPDLEDSSVPRLSSELAGILNVRDALMGTFKFTNPKGKEYVIGPDDTIAMPIVRLPGLHFREASLRDHADRAVPNHLLCAALYQFYVAPAMRERGMTPSIYQPKLQTMADARLVDNVLGFLEKELGQERGSTKATWLVETLLGAKNMEAIVYAMKERCVGANAGRWDYIFNWIQCLPEQITPDRSLITMQTAHMEAYLDHIRDVCERRGIVPMGGMSPFIPDMKNPERGEAISATIEADKKHEREHGMRGGWSAHPGIVETVMRGFTDGEVTVVPRRRVSVEELTTLPADLNDPSKRTEKGLRLDISVGIQYVAAWIAGRGAVALNGLMEDMATAEISRLQLWQWFRFGVTFTNAAGEVEKLTPEVFNAIFASELAKVLADNEVPYALEHLDLAAQLFKKMVRAVEADNFIADRAYAHLNHDVEVPKPIASHFTPWKAEASQLGFHGSMPSVVHGGTDLLKLRAGAKQRERETLREDGHPTVIIYQGAMTGVAARAIILGGNNPYGGGWQNCAAKGYPDALNVSVEDVRDTVEDFNRVLREADRIEWNDFQQEMKKVQALPEAQREEGARRASNLLINYMGHGLVVDGEQGWLSPERTRQLVELCIANGVTKIHIEDQALEKVCGHLGGKTQRAIHLVAKIFESANAAAQDIIGPSQLNHGFLEFVARTDALSAVKIAVNEELRNPEHPDHRFIDWDQASPDGNYYFLKGFDPEIGKKSGFDPESGLPWGLAHAAVRSAYLVKRGLAPIIWMETPNADLETMRAYRKEVLRHLEGSGQRPLLMYNISPSFKWYANFLKEAQAMSQKILDYAEENIAPNVKAPVEDGGASFNKACYDLQTFIEAEGDLLRGDQWVSKESVEAVMRSVMDKHLGETASVKTASVLVESLQEALPGSVVGDQLKAVSAALEKAKNPLGNIQHELACHRLSVYLKALSAVWGKVDALNTLPDFRATSVNMAQLAHDMKQEGMLGYVRNIEWREAALKEVLPHYTLDNHQHTSGAGVFAERALKLGSGNASILSGSTEEADEDVFASEPAA